MGMPTTRVEERDDGSGELVATGGVIPGGTFDPSGGLGAWTDHGLCTGGHDVVDGMTSLHNRSGRGSLGSGPRFYNKPNQTFSKINLIFNSIK